MKVQQIETDLGGFSLLGCACAGTNPTRLATFSAASAWSVSGWTRLLLSWGNSTLTSGAHTTSTLSGFSYLQNCPITTEGLQPVGQIVEVQGSLINQAVSRSHGSIVRLR